MAVLMQNCKIMCLSVKQAFSVHNQKAKKYARIGRLGTTSPDHKQPMALVLQMIKPALPLTHLQVLGLTRSKAQKQTPLGAGEFTGSIVEKDTS